MLRRALNLRLLPVLTVALVALATVAPARAATFVNTASEPFGTFGGIEYLRYTGRFVGTTAFGVYRMPFEIVAPVDRGLGNKTVLIEPPHFFFGPAGRDGVLGRAFLFSQGYSYASVGYGTFGLNILDPTAPDLVLAGELVEELGPERVTDFEILVQFVHALESEPFAVDALGAIERKVRLRRFTDRGYVAGDSASAERPEPPRLHRSTANSGGRPGRHPPSWRCFRKNSSHLSGVGKVIFVESEGDLLISGAQQFRRAVVGPDADLESYRVYEVAGAPHLPLEPPFNPSTSVASSARCSSTGTSGSAQARRRRPACCSRRRRRAPSIRSMASRPALPGTRISTPSAACGSRTVEVGRARFIASLPDFEILPGSPGLVGAWFDLQCVPLADGSVRFTSHGDYVSRVVRQANSLRRGGYLPEADAEALKAQAAESEVGMPGVCDR